jgi:vitamin B12 transporter
MKIAVSIGLGVLGVLAWIGGAGADDADHVRAEMTMEPMVVSPTRSEQPLSQTAPAITIVTGEDLRRKQVPTVADALREVPGLEVSETGPRGSATSILMRGADADQVLVLIDGVPANSTTIGAYDFSGLTPDNVERIEVTRGWGGTLYGSSAVGGVIQIFTRRGSGPPRGSISAAGGNGRTDREVAEVSGSSGIVSFSGSVSHIHTDGFQPENDDYQNVVASGRLDADVLERGAAEVVFRFIDSQFGNALSNNFLAAPDPNARQRDQQEFVRAQWGHSPIPMLHYRLSFSYAREDQHFDDLPDAAEMSTTHSRFLSQTFDGNLQGTLDWLDGHGESTAGLEYQVQNGNVDSRTLDPTFGDSSAKFDRYVGNVAGYSLHQLFFDDRRLVLTAGVRADGNQRFGEAVSPSGAASYLVAATDTRLRATYAEGFKAPTLNQLFFPGFGNPNLDAETSKELDFGFDQSLVGGLVQLSADWFHRRVENLIVGVPQPDGLFLAENVGNSTVEGVETALEIEPIPDVRCGGSYTYLNVDASVDGRVRRPRHSGSIHVSLRRDPGWLEGDTLSADVRLLLVGSRLDFDPAAGFTVQQNPAYQRADVAASYSWPVAAGWWVKRLKVFGRIENLFDESYEEVLGFPARPINFLAGLGGEF